MKEYWKSLRKHVGHAPLILCGASVIVENEDGNILLQLRKDNNCWGYAGGGIELSESVEEAAARELFEETGLIAESLELFNVFSGKELYYIYPNGDEVYIIDVVFICKKFHGNLRCDENEVNRLQFFAINNLPSNISPPVKKSLEKYILTRT